MWGIHRPNETSSYLSKALELCNYSLNKHVVGIFAVHNIGDDGWGDVVPLSTLSAWKNAI